MSHHLHKKTRYTEEEKRRLVRRYLAKKAGGHGNTNAARGMGVSASTLERWAADLKLK